MFRFFSGAAAMLVPMALPRRTLVASAAALALAGAAIAPQRAAGAVQPTRGVVVIETALGYQQTAAAGTGVVLTSDGEILTNNHVIRGATKIRVLVPQSGRRYDARVLGYSVTSDIAVLRLQGASRLTTALLGSSTAPRRGQAVLAVGNAGGTRRLVVTRGSITAVGRTITAGDGQGNEQQLSGLIQTNAELRPGDSGGPLLDARGRVIGINSAASTGFSFLSGSNEGYAIPIDRALSIRREIHSGRGTATIHVGPTAFLGVAVHAAGYYEGGYVPGAVVDNVVSGGPADRAGLAPQDVIVTLDGTRVSTPASVARVLLRKKPGDTLTIAWIRSGRRFTGTARLVSGPPQ